MEVGILKGSHKFTPKYTFAIKTILDFDDAEGVKVSSHKGMVIEAKEELIFASQKKVSIESPNQIIMTTSLSGISMENEMHFNGMNTIIECTDETEFSSVKQEKQVEEPGYILRVDRRKKPDFFY